MFLRERLQPRGGSRTGDTWCSWSGPGSWSETFSGTSSLDDPALHRAPAQRRDRPTCGKGGSAVRILSGSPGGRTGTADCRAKSRHLARPSAVASAPAKDSGQPAGQTSADRPKGPCHPGTRCDETARRHPPDGLTQAKALRLPSPGRPRRHPPRDDDLANVPRHRREVRTPGHPAPGQFVESEPLREDPPGHRHEGSHGRRRNGGGSGEVLEGHRSRTERAIVFCCIGSGDPGTRRGQGSRTGFRPDSHGHVPGTLPEGQAPTALQAPSQLRRRGGRANGTRPDGAWSQAIHVVTG